MNLKQGTLAGTLVAALMAMVAAVDDERHRFEWDTDVTGPYMDYDPNTIKDCTAWYDNYGNKEWDTCEGIRALFTVSPADFARWNPTISVDCKGWKADKAYCVQVRSEWTTTPVPPWATTTEYEDAGPSAPTASETAPYGIPTWFPVGCFVNNDTEARAMETRITPEAGDESLTVAKCHALCFEYDNNPFAAGVSDGHTCWCGDYVVNDTVPDDECDVPCAGNSTETCGGRGLVFAYEAEFDLYNPDLADPSSIGTDVTASAEEGVPTPSISNDNDSDSAASTAADAWLYSRPVLQLVFLCYWVL